MTNIKYLLTLLLFIGIVSNGWGQTPFEERLHDIKRQLDVLSDSIVPGLAETTTISVSGTPLQSFLRTVAEGHDLNIQIDPSLSINLSNNFTNVQVKDLLYFLCQEYTLDIRFTGSIFSFFRYVEPQKVFALPPPKLLKIQYDEASGKLSYDLVNDSLKSFVRQVTALTGRNVIMTGGPDVENKLVRGYIRDLPLESALDKLAYTNGLKYTKTKDGVFIFESLQPTTGVMSGSGGFSSIPSAARSTAIQGQGDVVVKDSTIDIDVVNFPIVEIIREVAPQLGKNYILFSEVTGNITAKVRRIKFNDMLSFLFQGTNYTYKRSDDVYLIGQRNLEGFKTSEIYKLDFRPIDGIDKELPAELLKDIEIRVVKELNSLVFTGNKHRVDELIAFVKLIDQPVPNILIEVIVAETKKGFSIDTGISAFLSDSVPKTGGTLFPGLDMTLSSGSVNNALSKLDSKGIINLGRVSPRFYMTLQAMEKNNNLQVRSTPKLSAINGSKATLTIGESVYYLEQTQNITGGVTPITTTSQRFNKVEANLSISISPIVSGNEHITMDIVAEFSDFIPSTVQNAPPGNATRKFESKIRIKNEEMIILGGLEDISKSETGSGVPLLSRIPILKWFFSAKHKETSDHRLIVFIKPTLVY